MTLQHEAAAFRAFGYAVLEGCLTGAEMDALSAAFERAGVHATAFDHFGDGGTRMLSHAEDHEPLLASLVAHPRILALMREVFGAPGLYLGSYLWLNRDDTAWHTPGRPGEAVQILRVSVNLDDTSAEQGALHVLPGTQVPAWNRELFRNFGCFQGGGNRLKLDPHAVPGATAVATRRGDVIVWWNRLWHAAFERADGRPRRTLFLSYVPDPGDDAKLIANLRATVAGIVTRERPSLYAPCLSASTHPEVRWMAERLAALGVAGARRPTR